MRGRTCALLAFIVALMLTIAACSTQGDDPFPSVPDAVPIDAVAADAASTIDAAGASDAAPASDAAGSSDASGAGDAAPASDAAGASDASGAGG